MVLLINFFELVRKICFRTLSFGSLFSGFLVVSQGDVFSDYFQLLLIHEDILKKR